LTLFSIVSQSYESKETDKQKKKREARAIKKGKAGVTMDDDAENENSASEWFSWFLEQAPETSNITYTPPTHTHT